jgi:NitT/TauT family transport system permease protein
MSTYPASANVTPAAPEFAAPDPAEVARARAETIARIASWLLPFVVLFAAIGFWQWAVEHYHVQPYLLPSPTRIVTTLVSDWPLLFPSLINTLEITFGALALAVLFGGGLAVLFAQSRWIEMALVPFAITLQVTPIIAIAPLIIVYLKDVTLDFGLFKISDVTLQLLTCAWIVAFFPVLSNTTIGLNSADHNLRNLFELYGASRWQTLRFLRLPAALPYFLAGLKIASGLALIGAVVAEFVVGSQGIGSGLASRIQESAFRLNIPRMYAAVLLISLTGIAIYLVTSWVSHLLLRRWHESAIKREN